MESQTSFTVNKRDMVQAATFAATGLPRRRPVVPVLAGMHVDVTAGKVTLSGFDYDTTATVSVSAAGTVAGVILPRGREFLNAVKSLPGGKGATITAVASESGLTLTAGGVTSTVELLPMEDYPQLPAMPAAAGVMDASAFVTAVKRVSPCAGTDDTLPVLMCLHVAFAPEAVRFVATDRYRLATDVAPWTAGNVMEQRSANVDARALATFAGKISADGKVGIYLGEPISGAGGGRLAGFSDGERSLITHTTEAEFVRYEALMGQDTAARALVDATALGAAVKRAGGQCERNMPAYLHVTSDGITVQAMRDGAVTYSETVACAVELTREDKELTAGGWEVRYNPAYLGSILGAVDGLALLSWATPNKPMHVTAADDDDRYLALIMGIRNGS